MPTIKENYSGFSEGSEIAKLVVIKHSHKTLGEGVYYPDTLEVELFKENEKLVDLSFRAMYNENNEPSFMEGTLYLKPYTLSLFFEDKGTNEEPGLSFEVNAELKRNNRTMATIEGREIFNNNSKDSLGLIDVELRYRDVKLKGDINIASIWLNQEEAGGITELFKEYADLDLTTTEGDFFIGELYFHGRRLQELDSATVFFEDSSTVQASQYYGEMVDAFHDNKEYLEFFFETEIGQQTEDILDITWEKIPF
jgi:hypothetical protein